MVFLRLALIPEEMIQQKGISQIIYKLRLQAVASSGFPAPVLQAEIDSIKQLFPELSLEFVNQDPQGIFFASGGSEEEAIQRIGNRRHVLLLAFSRRNAFASAVEVKSYLQRKGVEALLYNLDEPKYLSDLVNRVQIWSKVRSFTHKKIGLIGQPAKWLVNSKPDPNNLRARFGIRLVLFPWESFDDPGNYAKSKDFLDYYQAHGKKTFEEHSRLDSLVSSVWDEHQLDGISVACFPVVDQHDLTACLSLARLNAQGLPASCEGDLISLVGMLLIRSVCGQIPWMANLSGLFDKHVECSHCTVAPSLVDSFKINSHYETDKGLAIQGDFAQGEFTLFRMDQQFEQCFIAVGELIPGDHKPEACRTQLRLKLDQSDIQKLHHHPLGNHHLILPGNWMSDLLIACEYLNFTII